MYPEYLKKNGGSIYLTGESFGGKYLTMFGKYIDDYSNKNDGNLDVKGVILGNPLVSPPLQRITTHRVA